MHERDRDSGLARVASLTRWVAGGAAGTAVVIAVAAAHPRLPTVHLSQLSPARTQPSGDAGLQAPAQAPAPSQAPVQAASGGS